MNRLNAERGIRRKRARSRERELALTLALSPRRGKWDWRVWILRDLGQASSRGVFAGSATLSGSGSLFRPSGGIARGLAQPPANFWQPSGLGGIGVNRGKSG